MWICGCRIHFTDGGPLEVQLLHSGSLEECEAIYKQFSGVAYKGERPVKRAELVIMETEESK
jgi:hypothetical protein